jgi:hypothetical protein
MKAKMKQLNQQKHIKKQRTDTSKETTQEQMNKQRIKKFMGLRAGYSQHTSLISRTPS